MYIIVKSMDCNYLFNIIYKHMNLGLVLSGGGMRGAAHIGAIKALEE